MTSIRTFALFALSLFGLLAACSERPHIEFDDPTVRVRIVSDYAAGIETNRAEVVVLDEAGRTLVRADRPLLRGTALLDGVEVAAFESVRPGTYSIRGSLKREDGTTLGSAVLAARLEGGSVHTLYILSSCEGVECGEGTVCLQGTCVDPECSLADPTKCPPDFFCESDSDCDATEGSCSVERCVGRVCANTPIAGRCGETEYCAREDGCAPIDMSDMPDVPPGPDPRCGTVCRVPDEPCRYGYVACTTNEDGATLLVCTPFTTRPTGAPCGNGTVCNEDAECVEGGDAGVDAGVDAGIVTMDMGGTRDLGTPLDLAVAIDMSAPLDMSAPVDMRVVPDAAPNVCDPNPCGVGRCTPNDRARIGYLCACPDGYEPTAITCVDINECETGDFTCDRLTECVNTAGAYTCTSCPAGYSGDGLTGCTPIEIDECANGTDDCTVSQHCVDATPGYSCHDAVSLVGGGGTTCVVFDNGDMKCWGRSGYGIPNAPRSAAIELGGRTVRSVDARNVSVCATYDDNTVHCSGYNGFGMLGYGDEVNRTTFGPAIDFRAGCTDVGSGTACAVSTIGLGEYSTCATLNGGDLKCWGNGNFGEIGYGDSLTRRAPEPTDLVDVGAPVLQTVGGNAHRCALLAGGGVKCWGLSDAGTWGGPFPAGGDRLGYGPASSLYAPRAEVINLGTGCGGTCSATAIAATTQGACALLNGGYVKCWGWNNFGQLGTGDLNGRFTPNPTTPVNLGGNCNGASCSAAAIDADNYHVCALMTDGSVKCWGNNANGELGYDDATNRSAPDAMPIDFGAGERATHIGTNSNYSCALLDDLSVRCWGYSMAGRNTPVNLRGRGI